MDDRRNHLAGTPPRKAVARGIALLFIGLFLFCATVIAAFAASLTPLSVSAPSQVMEGYPVAVSVAGPGNLTIVRGGVVVAQGTGSIADTLATNSTSAGIIVYQFTSDVPGMQNVTHTIEILDVPLNITITSPASSDIAAPNVAFGAVTNWPADLCYVNIDGTSHSLTQQNATVWNGTLPVADGVHSVDLKCTMGAQTAVQSTTLHVDTTPPTITAASPTGQIIGPYATLTVDTDEIAMCRYGTVDAGYSALPNAMSDTFVLRNTVTVQLSEQRSYTYFVRCVDVSGNAMPSSVIISFLNELPPQATISIDGNASLRAGTYPLTLTTNVPLSQAPSLTATLQQSGTTQQIALDGSGTSWTGYVVIPPNVADTVLSFAFDGTSIQGVEGKTIVSGSLFTISAKAPPPVDALVIDNTSSYIKLKWFSLDPGDADMYNIYRADHEGVTYADYYISTAQTEYTDTNVDGARYYYYRVAPVDAAGNVGQLSIEVYGSSIDPALQENGSGVSSDPMQLARIDTEVIKLNAASLDADAAIKALEGSSNPTEAKIIGDMGLVKAATDAKASIDSTISSLQGLRATGPSKEAVDAALGDANKALADARHAIVTRITPGAETELKQDSDLRGLENNVPFALTGVQLSAQERDAYVQSAVSLQDIISVTLSAESFTLYDSAGSSQDYTFVRKQVSVQNPGNDLSVIEVIPKTVASDAGEITFMTAPNVLQQDPVVQYSFPVLQQQEFSYYVKRAVSLEEVKNSRTFVYPSPTASSATSSNQSSTADNASASGTGDAALALATGDATRLSLPGVGPASTDAILIVVGLIVIAGLVVYYVSLSRPSSPFRGWPQPAAHGAKRSDPVVKRGFGAWRNGALRYYPPAGSRPGTGVAGAASASAMPAVPQGFSSRVVTRPLASSSSAPSVAGSLTQSSTGSPTRSAATPNANAPAMGVPVASGAKQALPSISSEEVNDMILQAESLIDQKRYDDALALYRRAMSSLRSDAGLQEILRDECVRVYDKLLLFKRLGDAKASVAAKDIDGIRRALDDVKSLASKIGDEETVLVRGAKDSYAEFVRAMNAIEIERSAKY